MQTLTSYTIDALDAQNKNITVTFHFDDGTKSQQKLSINPVLYDEEITDTEGNTSTVRSTKTSFDVSDITQLDKDIRAYAQAYIQGVNDQVLDIDPNLGL